MTDNWRERVFQRMGATILKTLSQKVHSLVWGMESKPVSEDHRVWNEVC